MQPVQRFVSRCAGAKSPKSRPQPGKGSPDRMEDRLSEYFDQVWNLDDQNVTKERNAIAEHIHHVLQGIHLITRAKSDEMEELQESWMNKI